MRSRWRWWWISDFSDKISRGCFRNAVYENAQKRNLEEESEGHGKPKQDAFSIFEPPFLLLRIKVYTIEIRHKLKKLDRKFYQVERSTYKLSHKSSGRKVGLQKYH